MKSYNYFLLQELKSTGLHKIKILLQNIIFTVLRLLQ